METGGLLLAGAKPWDVASAPAASLVVAGLAISMKTTAPDLRLAVEGAASRFVATTQRPDLRLSVAWGAPAEGSPGALLFDSGGAWRLYHDGDGLLFSLRTPVWPGRPYRSARVDRELREGEVLLGPTCHRPNEPVDPLEFPLDELLFTHLLAHGRGVELHACGLVTPSGQGLLFAGQSGDGKSTIARLWAPLPGVTVLSDDRVIVRREGGRSVIYGTPWHGDARLATNASAPLVALFVLERGPRSELVPMARPAAVAALLARSFVPFYDREALERSLALLGEVTAEVPCYRFPFVPDASAVEVAFAEAVA